MSGFFFGVYFACFDSDIWTVCINKVNEVFFRLNSHLYNLFKLDRLYCVPIGKSVFCFDRKECVLFRLERVCFVLLGRRMF